VIKSAEIGQDQWIPWLAEFTRENAGARARVEVMGPGIGHQVVTEDRIFAGVAADVRDGERGIWISFGALDGNHFTHGVQAVTALRGAGGVLEIESGDGTKTVLRLSR
jgi:hypothetical protein